jgi:hypothetical protein
MCVDCVLASLRIAQVDPGDESLPEVVLSQLVSMTASSSSCSILIMNISSIWLTNQIIIENRLKEMDKNDKQKMSFQGHHSGSNTSPHISLPSQFFRAPKMTCLTMLMQHPQFQSQHPQFQMQRPNSQMQRPNYQMQCLQQQMSRLNVQQSPR